MCRNEAGDAAFLRHLRREPEKGSMSAIRFLRHCVREAPRNFARLLVKGYRLTLSPLVGFHCRHLPTCSQYADEALARHGVWAGGWMTLARLLRCQPYGTSGIDFVPASTPAGARWFLPWRYARWRGTNEIPPIDAPNRS
jgi:putative membrane protein insertion efficiency factor